MNLPGLVLLGAALTAAQQDTATLSLEWLVPTAEVDRGEGVPVWLHVRTGSTASDSVRIKLVRSPGTLHGFGPCTGSWDSIWTGTIARDTVVETCARRTAQPAFRLLAVARTTRGGGTFTGGSDLIRVTPNPFWPPGPMGMAIIAAILGFAGGLATQLATSALKARAETRSARTAAQKQAIAHLLPEMTMNRRLLEDYLIDPSNRPPPDLARTEFDKFFRTGGVGELLTVGSLASSLGRVRRAYAGPMVDYERAKNQKRDPAAAAQRVVTALDPYTSRGDS